MNLLTQQTAVIGNDRLSNKFMNFWDTWGCVCNLPLLEVAQSPDQPAVNLIRQNYRFFQWRSLEKKGFFIYFLLKITNKIV